MVLQFKLTNEKIQHRREDEPLRSKNEKKKKAERYFQ